MAEELRGSVTDLINFEIEHLYKLKSEIKWRIQTLEEERDKLESMKKNNLDRL